MRLFIAAEIPAGARERISLLLAALARAVPDVRWIRGLSVHLTIKFLGDADPSRISEISEALASAARRSPGVIRARLGGVQTFGPASQPRVVCIGVAEEAGSGAPLAALAATVDEACARLGFPRETKPFSPHITLARPKGKSRSLRSVVESHASDDPGPLELRSLDLFQSFLRTGGAEYVRVAEFPLGSPSGGAA